MIIASAQASLGLRPGRGAAAVDCLRGVDWLGGGRGLVGGPCKWWLRGCVLCGRHGRCGWWCGGGRRDDVGGGKAQEGHCVAVCGDVLACGDAVVGLQAVCAGVGVLAGCAVADVAFEEFAEVSAVGVDFVLEDGKGRVLEGVVFGDCGVGGVCVRVAA